MDVDRENRDKLVDAMRRYLDEEISAFGFDDKIFRIRDQTCDRTVTTTVMTLWCYYDDCKDHQVVLSKEAWDYFQRLMLVLESNAHIQTSRCRRWSMSQFAAAAGLLAFMFCALQLGFGYHLLAIAIPFGLMSIGLSRWRQARQRHPTREQIAMVPFSSISEILAVRRKAPEFSKQVYPAHLTNRQIRSPVRYFAVQLQAYAAWLMFSPFVLFVQMLPESEYDTRVVIQ